LTDQTIKEKKEIQQDLILFNGLLWHFLYIWLCKVEYWNKTDPLLFSIGESLVHFHLLHRHGFRQTESSLHYEVKSHSSY